MTVGWHDPRTHLLTPTASAGDQKRYLDDLAVDAEGRPEDLGPVGICFRSGKPCVINDFVDDPRANLWRERRIAYGLRSSAAVPLRLEGEVCGVFIVYAGESDVFQDKEVDLLEEIADSISFAMDNLEQEGRRQRAEERSAIERPSIGLWSKRAVTAS